MSELFRRALERWVSFTRPEPSGLEALFADDDETYARDTAALEVHRRRSELSAAYWWLRDGLPEVWYFEPHERVIDMAEALVTLRRGVEAGRWEVEAVKT